jgi:hypothetical protein
MHRSTHRTGARVEPLEPRRLFDATVTIGNSPGAKREVLFTEPDGSLVRLSLNRGTAQILIEGTIVTTQSDALRTILGGPDLRVGSIDVQVSDDRSILTGTARGGDGNFSAGTVNIPGVINVINAPKMGIRDSISIGGVIRLVSIHNLRSANMTVGAQSTKPIIIRMNSAWDSTFDSDAPVRLFDAKKFYQKDELTPVRIAIPRADMIRIREDLDADIQIPGFLGTAYIGDDVLGGTWVVNGGIRSITADSFSSTATIISPRVDRIVTRESTSGIFQLGSLGSFSIGGALEDARISLFDPYTPFGWNLGSLTARGEIDNLQLFSDGNLGSIFAGRGMVDSSVFAGLDFSSPNVMPGAFPTGDVFVSPTMIRSIRLGGDPSFFNSYITSYYVGTMNLGSNVLVTPGGDEFGALVREVRTVSGRTTQRVPFIARIPLLGDFFTQTVDKGRDTQNLVVTITPQLLNF